MRTIGIYQDGNKLKMASISHKRLIERLEEPTHYLEEEWKGVLSSGISGDKVLVRQIDSPLKNRRILEKTLPFQLEALIPFSFDEIIAVPIHRFGKRGTKTTLFLASKELLEKHISSFQVADPAWVSCVPMALCRFAHFVEKDRGDLVVFYVGGKTSELISIDQGIVRYNLSIGIGADQLESAYREDKPQEQATISYSIPKLNLSSLSQREYPQLSHLLREFQREIDRAFCFLSHKQEQSTKRLLLFAGETEALFQLEDWMKSWNTFSYEVLPIGEKQGYDPKIIKRYAVPIGLALDAGFRDKRSIQFRQGTYIASSLYKSIKTKIIKGVSLCLTFAIAIFTTGYAIYKKQERSFVEEIDRFATTFQEKSGMLKKLDLTPAIEDKIQVLNRQFQAMGKESFCFSSPTRVADVLAFLSLHPKLNRQEGEKKIVINHLRYELIDYPSIQEPHQSYKIKVTIEIICPETLWASEFHDAIVEDKEWIGAREMVTWTHKQDRYTLSFILK